MKLEIQKEKILEAVNTTEKFSSKHISLPILSQILFTVEGNKLTIKATNLDVGIEYYIAVKNEKTEECSFAVSPQALKAFLTNVNEKNVSFEFTDNVLHISAGTSFATITTQAPDDFPNIPKIEDGEKKYIPAKMYVDGVQSVLYSASVSLIKPELSSIYMYPEGDELIFVATDSFRLAEKRFKTLKKNLSEFVLLPYKNALEVARVLEAIHDDVEVVLNKNQITFRAGDVFISSRAVDGVFPDYKQIIPKTFGSEVMLLKEDLLKALKLTSGFLDKFQQVVFVVSPQEKKISIKTKGGVDGEASQIVKVNGTGEEITITFNHKYIVDCLQSIKSESVQIKLVGNNKPVIITEASSPSFTYLVMPMNR